MISINGHEIGFMQTAGGPCRFCNDTEPHSHPICPGCLAIGFSTPDCRFCVEARSRMRLPPEEAPVDT